MVYKAVHAIITFTCRVRIFLLHMLSMQFRGDVAWANKAAAILSSLSWSMKLSMPSSPSPVNEAEAQKLTDVWSYVFCFASAQVVVVMLKRQNRQICQPWTTAILYLEVALPGLVLPAAISTSMS